MKPGRCGVGECGAKASITYLDHGVCEKHWNELTVEDAPPEALRKALGVEAPTILPMEETMTVPKAGSRRGKRSGDSKSPAKERTPREPRAKQEKIPNEPLVVFAFRLSEADRDRLHAASGPGGATRFARAAAMAAANSDTKAFQELAAQAKTNLE